MRGSTRSSRSCSIAHACSRVASHRGVSPASHIALVLIGARPGFAPALRPDQENLTHT
jgi:hypothetical protein